MFGPSGCVGSLLAMYWLTSCTIARSACRPAPRSSASAGKTAQPTDDEVKAWYENHQADFQRPAMVQLQDLFLSADSHDAARRKSRERLAWAAAAAATLAALAVALAGMALPFLGGFFLTRALGEPTLTAVFVGGSATLIGQCASSAASYRRRRRQDTATLPRRVSGIFRIRQPPGAAVRVP